MPRTKKTLEKKEEIVVQVNPFDIDASYVSISGEAKEFKARKFAPISEIAFVCEDIASAVTAEGGYHPYLEEFLVWTALVRLYTDLDVDELIEENADAWYEELTCTNLKDVLMGIILFSQYTLITNSVSKIVDYTIRNKKSSLDTLIDAFVSDGLLFDLLEKAAASESVVEGAEIDGQLS